MTDHAEDDGRLVELVDDVDEGKLTYIADMAGQLSLMATSGRHQRLAMLLDLALSEAKACVAKKRPSAGDSIVDCAGTMIRVTP